MAPSKKILLVQLYSYGDCLYATAVARQIKADYPGCYLVWAIAPFCKDILIGNPYVDEVMIVEGVKRNDADWYHGFEKQISNQSGYDKIFITNGMGKNQAYYDGCIRSNIFNAYPHTITVPIQPVVRLTDEEKSKAANFAVTHQLPQYKNVILFEYAPQSGQSNLTKEIAISIAEKLTAVGDTAVILSSANKINHPNKAVIDGSALTFRETAALTHACTFLIGSSSGITWMSTSDAAKQLPMVQLLNAYTFWVNPISRDFERFGLPTEAVIELIDFDGQLIVDCVKSALVNFSAAKQQYNQPVPLHFKTTRKIIYNLLVYGEFKGIVKHIYCNRKVYGNNLNFYWQVAFAFISAPFKLIKNIVTKRLLSPKMK